MEERIPRRSQATAAVVSSGGEDVAVDSDGEESEFEFEFPFVSRDGGDSPALADDLFADGRIRPFYPAFGRGGTGADDGTAPVVAAAPAVAPGRTRGQLGRLFLQESRERSASTGSTASTTSSSADDDLEGAPPDSYCVWAPGSSASPRPPRKSGSTGSMARWRRISDLVVGRSHSDGKEKFLFLPANPSKPAADRRQDNPNTKPRPRPIPIPAAGGGKKPPPTEIGTVAATHRIAYGAKASAGTPRRTFLPYREDLVGFFANVNGISRSHPHPY